MLFLKEGIARGKFRELGIGDWELGIGDWELGERVK